MMAVKVVGAAVVVFAAWVYGYYASEYTKKRMDELLDFKRAFVMFAAESEYLYCPIEEVFVSVGDRLGGAAKRVFGQMAVCLNEKQGEGADFVWEKCLLESTKDSFLDNEDKNNLAKFGKGLGFSGIGGQSSSIKLVIDYIDEKTDELNKKYQEEKRLYRSLSVMAALLGVVVII